MNKIAKYIVGIITFLLVIWLSLDIQNLEKHNSTLKSETFNATEYASIFWNDSLPLAITTSPNFVDLYKILNENPKKAFELYGKKLGISKTYYFLIKGKGFVEKIESEFLLVSIDSQTKVKIATDFIYGNAVREGSGKVNINHFINMTDFNSVSVAINKLVKNKVVAPLKEKAVVGQQLEFAGAFELNSGKINLSDLLIIPLSIAYSDGKSE